MKPIVLVLALICLSTTTSIVAASEKTVGVYYADWARYRASPYKYTSKDLAGVIDSVNSIYFGFSFFCPPSD